MALRAATMGFFDKFFKKENKQTYDQGLEKTKQGFFEKLTRAIAGRDTVDDEVLDNLEEILVTSDVGVETTLRIIERIEQRVARDKYVGTSELNRILREEITALLVENQREELDGFTVREGVKRPTSSSWWASTAWARPLPSASWASG